MRIEANMHEAKTQLSKLVAQAWEGHEIIITRDGKPVAELKPYNRGPRVLGQARGKIWMSPDFDDPLPEDIMRYFLGEGDDDDLLGPEEEHAPK